MLNHVNGEDRMNEREFVYWLQGFFEISDAKKLDATQVQVIRDHLALVLNKQTPNRFDVDFGFLNNPLGPALNMTEGSC